MDEQPDDTGAADDADVDLMRIALPGGITATISTNDLPKAEPARRHADDVIEADLPDADDDEVVDIDPIEADLPADQDDELVDVDPDDVPSLVGTVMVAPAGVLATVEI